MSAELATLERGMAEVNGTRLYYQVCGIGPALLFLHGYTLDHRMWEAQVDGLSDRFRTVVYDVRGFGRSAAPTGPYRHYEDAAALCEHLGLERVVVVGHSIGAHQSLELALARPDLVAGLVSICMASYGGVSMPDALKQMFAAINKAAREESVAAAKAIWQKAHWFAPARTVPGLAAELDRMLSDYSGWHFTHDNPVQHLEPPAIDRAAQLEAPALVITGGRDLEYQDRVADLLTSRIRKVSALRLPHVGHMANMEDPRAVNRAIGDFADRAHRG